MVDPRHTYGTYLVCPFLANFHVLALRWRIKVFIKKIHVPLFDCAGINKGVEGVILLYEPSRMLLQRKKKKKLIRIPSE